MQSSLVPNAVAASPRAISKQKVILVALAVATLLKVTWATMSVGHLDTRLFAHFGKLVSEHGVAWMYECKTVIFNHPPLIAVLCGAIHWIAGDDPFLFGSIFRAVTSAADVVALLALLRVAQRECQTPWWSLAALAASPVSIMVSGFHGNVDPIMTAFLVLAAVAAVKKQPAWCGLWFALSCNSKVVALMLTPAFFLYWMALDRRGALRWTATFAGVMGLGLMVPLIQTPAAFFKNVMGYGGLWGSWGVTFWLRESGLEAYQKMTFTGFNPAQETVMRLLKALIIGLVLLTTWTRRKLAGASDFFETLARCWIILFVVAPSGSPQYMVWFAPFVAVFIPRWSIALAIASSIYVAVTYGSMATSSFPWIYSRPTGAESVRYYLIYGNVPWAVFLACFAWLLRKDWLKRAEGKMALP